MGARQGADPRQYRPGQFTTFLGYEWHSNRYGDHTVYYNGAEGEIVCAGDMPEMRAALRQVREGGGDAMLMPHHIGYKAGYRGVNWDEVDPEFIHVVEIMSMHGASESPTIPYRYLHTMGPLDWRSSLQYGLAQGHVVGVVGGTDHHSAHPGSYGHGRAGVWASDLTREAIWQALVARRTYALTGDRIALEFALNGQPMGAIAPASRCRAVEVAVIGGDALDMIEILHNNRPIHRWNPAPVPPVTWPSTVKVYLELGWGERGVTVDWGRSWTCATGAAIRRAAFRGHEIVEPQASEQDAYAFSQWGRAGLGRRLHDAHRATDHHPPNTQGMFRDPGGRPHADRGPDQRAAGGCAHPRSAGGPARRVPGRLPDAGLLFSPGGCRAGIHRARQPRPRSQRRGARLVPCARAAGERPLGVELTDLGRAGRVTRRA